MKNIKKILMVLSLLAASAAFGCPHCPYHDGYMDDDMDDEVIMTEKM